MSENKEVLQKAKEEVIAVLRKYPKINGSLVILHAGYGEDCFVSGVGKGSVEEKVHMLSSFSQRESWLVEVLIKTLGVLIKKSEEKKRQQNKMIN